MYMSASDQIQENIKNMQHYIDEMPINEARIRFEYNQTKTISYYVCKAKIYEVDNLTPYIDDKTLYDKNKNTYDSIVKTGAVLIKTGAPWKIKIDKD